MDTRLIGEELKQIVRPHVVSFDHWFGSLVHITVQTCYDLQYINMFISGYINA